MSIQFFSRIVNLVALMMLLTSCMEVEHHVYGSKKDVKVRFEILANHSMVQLSDDQTGGDAMGDAAAQFRAVGKGMIVKEYKREKNGELYDVVSGIFSANSNNKEFLAYAPLFEKDKIIIPTPFDNSEWNDENSYLFTNSTYSVYIAKTIFPTASAAYTLRHNGQIREIDLKIKGNSYIAEFPILWWLNGNVDAVILTK